MREKYLIDSKTSIYQALSLSLSVSLAWLMARVLGVCLDAGIKSGRCVFFCERKLIGSVFWEWRDIVLYEKTCRGRFVTKEGFDSLRLKCTFVNWCGVWPTSPYPKPKRLGTSIFGPLWARLRLMEDYGFKP